jgi:HSP20 family protein
MQPQNPYYTAPRHWYAQSPTQFPPNPSAVTGWGVPPVMAPQDQPYATQPPVGTPTDGTGMSPSQGGASDVASQPGSWNGQGSYPEQSSAQAATTHSGTSQQSTPVQGSGQSAQPQGASQQQPLQQGPVSAEPGGQAAPVQRASPLIDVVENTTAIEIVVDLPGFDEDDIQLNADGQTLHVSAERTPDEDDDRVAIQLERPTHVERSIPIPIRVELDEASAVYDDGVCRVTLPKSEGETGTGTKIGFH